MDHLRGVLNLISSGFPEHTFEKNNYFLASWTHTTFRSIKLLFLGFTYWEKYMLAYTGLPF